MMRATHLILVVPDLESLIREAGDIPVASAPVILRGRQAALDSDFPQFSLLFPDDPPPGAAAIARRADLPDAGSGHWLRCDPVAMVPDLTRVWVGETRFDHLPDEISEDLRRALSELFADEGLEFHVPAPGRGYIRLAEAPDCRFHPPWRIAGEPLEHVLPEGREATRWRRLLNESQVLLHNLDFPAELPPNTRPTSVWFWGGGKSPGIRGNQRHDGTEQRRSPGFGETRTSSVGDGTYNNEFRTPGSKPRNLHLIGDDSLVRGLADWLEVPHHPASRRPDGGRWLVQWEPDRRRSAAENLEALEAQWLAPAWSALKWGRVRKFTLASMTSRRDLGTLRAWFG